MLLLLLELCRQTPQGTDPGRCNDLSSVVRQPHFFDVLTFSSRPLT
jgi:hypothetical protein